MQQNLIAVCKATFPEGSSQRDSCLSDAEAMFGAVYTFQESIGGKLDNKYSCPGQVRFWVVCFLVFNICFEDDFGSDACRIVCYVIACCKCSGQVRLWWLVC
jgi:hypothetical protein